MHFKCCYKLLIILTNNNYECWYYTNQCFYQNLSISLDITIYIFDFQQNINLNNKTQKKIIFSLRVYKHEPYADNHDQV